LGSGNLNNGARRACFGRESREDRLRLRQPQVQAEDLVVGSVDLRSVEFTGSGADGKYPEGRLTVDANGILYGTTPKGGSHGAGAV
jgi:hypothetical protein